MKKTITTSTNPTISVETHEAYEGTIKTLDFKFDNCTIVFEISDRSFEDLKKAGKIDMNAKVEFIHLGEKIKRPVSRAYNLATNLHMEIRRNGGRNTIYQQSIFARIHKL